MHTLPLHVIAFLEGARASIPQRNVPLEFWHIDSGPDILDAFMDLAARLIASDLDEECIPRGYVLLAHLFQWEADCQSDGWVAFGNIASQEFVRLCAMFSEVGLEAESLSLAHQMKVYRSDPHDTAKLVEAAEEFAHEFSGDLDRLEYLTQYFCDHADELLYTRDEHADQR